MMTPAELRRIAEILEGAAKRAAKAAAMQEQQSEGQFCDTFSVALRCAANERADLARKLRAEADERQQRENWTKQEHD